MGDIIDLYTMVTELNEKHNALVQHLMNKGVIEKPKNKKEDGD